MVFVVVVSEVTGILDRIHKGDPKAAEALLPLVYSELRRLAAHRMAHEPAGQTLQPTALVHEAWLRLVGNDQSRFDNRAHFFAAAAEAMRRILAIASIDFTSAMNFPAPMLVALTLE